VPQRVESKADQRTDAERGHRYSRIGDADT
jgi:hypothetical protein